MSVCLLKVFFIALLSIRRYDNRWVDHYHACIAEVLPNSTALPWPVNSNQLLPVRTRFMESTGWSEVMTQVSLQFKLSQKSLSTLEFSWKSTFINWSEHVWAFKNKCFSHFGPDTAAWTGNGMFYLWKYNIFLTLWRNYIVISLH